MEQSKIHRRTFYINTIPDMCEWETKQPTISLQQDTLKLLLHRITILLSYNFSDDYSLLI